MAETANGAVLAAGLQPQNADGLGNDHALLAVIWGRDTLEDLEAPHSGSSTSSLVRDHTTDSSPEDLRWGAEVEGTWERLSTTVFVCRNFADCVVRNRVSYLHELG